MLEGRSASGELELKKKETSSVELTVLAPDTHLLRPIIPFMRLSRSLLGPLRLPGTLSDTVRLLPPSAVATPPASTQPAPPAPSTVQGWVASLRTSKNIAFVGVNDGTLDRPLQVVVLGKKSAGGLRTSVRPSSPRRRFLRLPPLQSETCNAHRTL